MQPVWKILAPVDLSVDAEVQVDHALDVASALQAEVTLLSVTGQPRSKGVRRPGWPAHAVYRAQMNVDVHRLVLPGPVSETIVEYADFLQADLILMTSRNFGSWPRFRKATVTAAVMERARAALCISKRRAVQTDYRFQCRRILCYLNLDGSDEPAVVQATAVAQRSGGELILIAAIPGISEGLLLESIPGMDRPLSRNVAHERLRTLRWELPVPARSVVMVGAPYRCIHAAARDYSVDIVVTSHSERRYPNIYGPDPASILEGLCCPLLSARTAPPVHAGSRIEKAPVAVRNSGY